jgi:hypothetical protein
MGMRIRLKAGFDTSGFSSRALQIDLKLAISSMCIRPL